MGRASLGLGGECDEVQDKCPSLAQTTERNILLDNEPVLSCRDGDVTEAVVCRAPSWPWARPVLRLSLISSSSQPQSEVGAVYTIASQAVGPRGRSHLPSVPTEQVLQPRVDSGPSNLAELPLHCSLMHSEASLATGRLIRTTLSRAGSEPFIATPFPCIVENSSTQVPCI